MHKDNAFSRWGLNCRRTSGILTIALLLGGASRTAWTAPVPQQAGAVPLAQGIADVAAQLAKSIPEGHPMTIAVTDFPQKKQVCGLGQFVAERLSTLLSRQPQCRLIERHRLDQVLQELKFSMSELVDPAKARRLGQMLGVQGLVVGTVTDLGTTFDVDARIIDIQTDVSLPGASASVVKDETVRSLSADCPGSAMPSVGPGSAGPTGVQPPQAKATGTGGHIGATVARVQEGIVLTMVAPESPAANAGLRAGDVIVSFGGSAVIDAPDLLSRVDGTPTGKQVAIVYLRGGEREQAQLATAPFAYTRVGDFWIVVRTCQWVGGGVECRGSATNGGNHNESLQSLSGSIVDSLGNRTPLASAVFSGTGSTGGLFVPNVPIRFGIAGQGIDPSATLVTLILQGVVEGRGEFQESLRNVPLHY